MTLAILTLGFVSFGFWTMVIFSSGFGVGFLLWLAFPNQPSLGEIKWPFFVAFALFIAHRVEEYLSRFFEELRCRSSSVAAFRSVTIWRGPHSPHSELPSWRTCWFFPSSQASHMVTFPEWRQSSCWHQSLGGACGG
jgi:hypothetical protein